MPIPGWRKDDSLSISGAGEKLRKLIDEHLVSLGVNPKIPLVELLSPAFITQLDYYRFTYQQIPNYRISAIHHARVDAFGFIGKHDGNGFLWIGWVGPWRSQSSALSFVFRWTTG